MKLILRRILFVSTLGLAATGCTQFIITHDAVAGPNRYSTPDILRPASQAELQRMDTTYAAAWRLPVGPPAAELAVAVVAPGDYGMIHSIQRKPKADGGLSAFPVTTWNVPAVRPDPQRPAKATILILHGFGMSKEQMFPWALYLAQAGYRCVLVDLRGHGRSTGDFVSFGAWEVPDLRAVLDDLAKRGLIQGPVGVLGLAYGASLGLELGAADPRVGAIVALEPYSDSKRGLIETIRAVAPNEVKDWSEQDFQTALDTGAAHAHFTWQADDVYQAVAARPVPTLYFHATNDPRIPVSETKQLAAHTAGTQRAGYLTYPGGDAHILLSWTLDPLAPAAADWFETALLHPGPGLQQRLEQAGPRSGTFIPVK